MHLRVHVSAATRHYEREHTPILMFIITSTYAQTRSVKLVLKLLRHVSVLINHLKGVHKLAQDVALHN
jgi:hypothetical protein